MVCIYCGNDTKVINSRFQKRSNNVWRRRQCLNCNNVFTSIEQPELQGSLVVKKIGGRIEPFSSDKLLISVYEACKHRKTAVNDAAALTDTIIGRLQKHIANASLTRTDIVKVASEVLKRFDRSAQVQYLAFHPLDRS